jgi:hypothetical protein
VVRGYQIENTQKLFFLSNISKFLLQRSVGIDFEYEINGGFLLIVLGRCQRGFNSKSHIDEAYLTFHAVVINMCNCFNLGETPSHSHRSSEQQFQSSHHAYIPGA